MLVLETLKVGWVRREVETNFLDDRGILLANFVAIRRYHWMCKKNSDRITMLNSVSDSLSRTFVTLVPGLILLNFLFYFIY